MKKIGRDKRISWAVRRERERRRESKIRLNWGDELSTIFLWLEPAKFEIRFISWLFYVKMKRFSNSPRSGPRVQFSFSSLDLVSVKTLIKVIAGLVNIFSSLLLKFTSFSQ
jgi:hypothetical protein